MVREHAFEDAVGRGRRDHPTQLQTGRDLGMQMLDQALHGLGPELQPASRQERRGLTGGHREVLGPNLRHQAVDVTPQVRLEREKAIETRCV